MARHSKALVFAACPACYDYLSATTTTSTYSLQVMFADASFDAVSFGSGIDSRLSLGGFELCWLSMCNCQLSHMACLNRFVPARSLQLCTCRTAQPHSADSARQIGSHKCGLSHWVCITANEDMVTAQLSCPHLPADMFKQHSAGPPSKVIMTLVTGDHHPLVHCP